MNEEYDCFLRQRHRQFFRAFLYIYIYILWVNYINTSHFKCPLVGIQNFMFRSIWNGLKEQINQRNVKVPLYHDWNPTLYYIFQLKLCLATLSLIAHQKFCNDINWLRFPLSVKQNKYIPAFPKSIQNPILSHIHELEKNH